MGTYFQAVCDDFRERIDPGEIDDLGIKISAISHRDHPFGSLLVFALSKRWSEKSVTIVADYDPRYFDYENVTESVLKEYNEFYGTNFSFTGSSG